MSGQVVVGVEDLPALRTWVRLLLGLVLLCVLPSVAVPFAATAAVVAAAADDGVSGREGRSGGRREEVFVEVGLLVDSGQERAAAEEAQRVHGLGRGTLRGLFEGLRPPQSRRRRRESILIQRKAS